jgi:hypothetical protein
VGESSVEVLFDLGLVSLQFILEVLLVSLHHCQTVLHLVQSASTLGCLCRELLFATIGVQGL